MTTTKGAWATALFEEMVERGCNGFFAEDAPVPGYEHLWEDVKPQARAVLTAAGVPALIAARNAAYTERNQVVAALARLFPSGVRPAPDCDGEAEPWHIVYINLPTGQASWHYPESDAHLFAGLPPYGGAWDGHATEEKYRRLAALANMG